MSLKWVAHSRLAPTDAGRANPLFSDLHAGACKLHPRLPATPGKHRQDTEYPRLFGLKHICPKPPSPHVLGLARQIRKYGNWQFQNLASRTLSLACTRSVQLHNAESVKPIVVNRSTYNLSQPNRCSTLLRYPFSPNPSTPKTGRLPNASGVWGCAHSNGEFRLR